ncbi:hypothetical protein [Plasticicumulans acidivorans]|uniref:Lipoprotein n=1 Tax=Plasticicumulans acidivorans TaxID=886464 RepID=A0A317MXU9_9GAMM|nr:hypothetical protein [Plasticicumulans acidivorans]PWV64364.1 hypothetical protein C7443_10213 [Plasticicumulans acidivorans]
MRALRFAVLLPVLLAGCATPAPPLPVQPYTSPANAETTAADGCGHFATQMEFAPLREHLALDNLTSQTPQMLADRRVPTRAERTLIRRWLTQRDSCQRAAIDAEREQSSPQMIALDEQLLRDNQALGEQLAKGRLSYGEFARRRQALVDRYNDDWQAQWQAYSAARSEAERRAAEDAWLRDRYWRDRAYYDSYWGTPAYGPGWYAYPYYDAHSHVYIGIGGRF